MSYGVRANYSRFSDKDCFRPSYGNGNGSGNYGSKYGNANSDDTFLNFSVKNDWAEERLKPFEKNFYKPSSECSYRTSEEVNAYRNTRNVNVIGENIPNPFVTFTECNFPSAILSCLSKEGFQVPTPIQGQGMPIVLSGHNMVGIAQTGSGKTMAYVLPALVHVLNQPPLEKGDGPLALILAPTRELAQQIQQVLSLFQSCVPVKSTVIYGGAAKDNQLSWLERGVEILIATPGRLIDFMDSNQIQLNRVTMFVLDEADRMLDMGFKPQIKKVINRIRPDRQMLMWSATWPKEVQQMASEFISNYTQLCIGSAELSANRNILQFVDVCEENEKDFKLRNLLNEISMQGQNKTIIFVRTKKKVDEITYDVKRSGWRVAALHGNKNQSERDRVLAAFRNGSISLLVATDVAARGLDVQDVKFVINFDFPSSSEDYIHRIGRTGRNKNSGTSYAFFTRDNVKQLDSLIAILREADQKICPRLLELAERNSRSGNYRKRRYDGHGESGNGGSGYNNDYANKKPRSNWNGNFAAASSGMGSGRGGGGQVAPGSTTERRSRWDSGASADRPRYAASYQQSAAPQSYSVSGPRFSAATSATPAGATGNPYGSGGGACPPYPSYQQHAPPPPLPPAYASAAPVVYQQRF